jgi:hypothetical protein
MVYINWDSCFPVADSSIPQWYSVQSVAEYLGHLRSYIILDSKKIMNIPLLTSTQIPASETERFQGCFICESIGDWGFNLNKLSWMLVKLNSRPSFRISSIIELEILRLIHDSRKAIESKVNFIDKVAFESRYGLIWKAEKEEEEHDVTKCSNVFCQYYKDTIVYFSCLLLGKSIKKSNK